MSNRAHRQHKEGIWCSAWPPWVCGLKEERKAGRDLAVVQNPRQKPFQSEGRWPQGAAAHCWQATTRCPVCATLVGADPIHCTRCENPHHRDCWEFSGGCAIFGCERRWREVAVPLSGWDELQQDTRQWINRFTAQWETRGLHFSHGRCGQHRCRRHPRM